MEKRSLATWIAGGTLAGGLLPFLLYWLVMGGVSSVSVGEAKRLLDQSNSVAILVDIRSPEACSANPVAGAVNWPAANIASFASLKDLPPMLQGKKLLLIDEDGLGGARVVLQLRNHPGLEAFNVSGGIALWDTDLSGKHSPLRLHPISIVKQWVAVSTGFVIKPLHMLLCVLVILWLWPQRAPDLVALRWGLLIFWLGEVACGVNYLFMGGFSEFWEYLHNYGNSVGFSFTTYAVLEGVDRRVIKYSAAKDRCAAIGLCRACIKYTDVPCGLRRIFNLIIPATILMALMLLCVPIQVLSYNASVFGSVTDYSHLIGSQLYELRYCSLLSIALLTASWLVLLCRREDPVTPSKILYAAATGPLLFGFVRLFVFSAYSADLPWADFWEETTELLYVVSAAAVLWIFRDSLFVKPTPAAPEPICPPTTL
jgi:rhodanese-related sulfurtransferase